MNWFSAQSLSLDRPATIVHLGAGVCKELDAYRALKPDQIVLVEPNPDQLEVLRGKAGSTEKIHIIESAVSAKDSDNILTILSDPRLSSLREPTRLFELMPGLTIERQIQVATQSVNDLMETLALDSLKCNWLVIETPGIEGELIQCLRDSGKLSDFSHIFLGSSCEPFYDGACSISQTLSELNESGYTIVGGPDESDADHPVYHLQLGGLLLENKRLGIELNGRDQQIESVTAELQESQLEVQNKANELSVALKLQMLRESDLEDLQRRYGEVLNLKNRQAELLKSMKERLSSAASYLRQLDADEGPEEEDEVAAKLLKAISGSPED